MPVQINVGAEVVRIANMVDRAEEGITEIFFEFRGVSFVRIPSGEDVDCSFSPLIEDSLEVEIDEVGSFGARLQAFGITAPNRASPESRQGFLGPVQLQPYGFDLFKSGLDWSVARLMMSLGF